MSSLECISRSEMAEFFFVHPDSPTNMGDCTLLGLGGRNQIGWFGISRLPASPLS